MSRVCDRETGRESQILAYIWIPNVGNSRVGDLSVQERGTALIKYLSTSRWVIFVGIADAAETKSCSETRSA